MSNVSKYVFGKNKLGRMKRTVECDSTTFSGVQWIPNFKGSQRGAVLKTTNDLLLSHGMRKRSQIDSLNGEDISNLPFKKIQKILNEFINSNELFLTSFMIPEQEVTTIEIFFRGKFCFDYITFSCDENDSNFIISSINMNNKDATKLIEKSNINIGYRIIKVKGIKVINKKYNDILKMIEIASSDLRVDYGIIFEQGQLDWYNIKKPSKSSSKNSTHLKHAKTVTNLDHKRRKSGNLLTQKSVRHSLKGSSSNSSKHVKKTRSFDFGRNNILNSKSKYKSKGNAIKRSSRTIIPKTELKAQIGKISFGTSMLGQTRRTMQCDSNTFIDVDFIPNFKGSQRGAVLKRTNETLLRKGFIRKTQIDSINGQDVSSESYYSIINALNEYISADEIFEIAFMIPPREVKTIEVFFRGSFMEYMKFVPDEKGQNCIIKTINDSNSIINKLKGKLNIGYRIVKIKTKNVTNKKFSDITKWLVDASKDMRVQYLVVFEQGELGWYGYEKEEEEEEDMPLHVPHTNYTGTNSASSIVVNDVNNNVIDRYGIENDNNNNNILNEENKSDSGSGYDGSEQENENSLVIHSSDSNEEIDEEEEEEKEQEEEEEENELEETLKKAQNNLNMTCDANIKLKESDSRGSEILEQMALAVTEELELELNENKNNKNSNNVIEKQNVIEKEEIIINKKRKSEEKIIVKNKKEKKEKIKKDKKDKNKNKNMKNEIKNNIKKVIRKRFIAKIKNVCIAAPFNPNETLLSFQREILLRIPTHKKLRKDKNLTNRIRYIKLQTPKLSMLIDCDVNDKIGNIASSKDMIVFHTQSDDEYEETYWD